MKIVLTECRYANRLSLISDIPVVTSQRQSTATLFGQYQIIQLGDNVCEQFDQSNWND